MDLSDEELLGVMEEFALMSEEEREEAFAEVVDMLGGDDDPEIAAAVREIMDAVSSLDGSDAKASPAEYVSTSMEREIADATGIALEMISKSDWELISNKRVEILDALISEGKVTAEDAALYKSDDGAWEKELRSVWDELQNQAREHDAVNAKGEL